MAANCLLTLDSSPLSETLFYLSLQLPQYSDAIKNMTFIISLVSSDFLSVGEFVCVTYYNLPPNKNSASQVCQCPSLNHSPPYLHSPPSKHTYSLFPYPAVFFLTGLFTSIHSDGKPSPRFHPSNPSPTHPWFWSPLSLQPSTEDLHPGWGQILACWVPLWLVEQGSHTALWDWKSSDAFHTPVHHPVWKGKYMVLEMK